MSFPIALYALGAALVTASGPIHRAVPVVQPNSNTESAGLLRGGVLTVTLEAKESQWRSDGLDSHSMILEAFSEPGKPPLVPGPLLRVPAGTEIRLSVRNALSVALGTGTTVPVPNADFLHSRRAERRPGRRGHRDGFRGDRTREQWTNHRAGYGPGQLRVPGHHASRRESSDATDGRSWRRARGRQRRHASTPQGPDLRDHGDARFCRG